MLLKIFWTFLKIGIFTFGGGYSMVALIQDEVVRKQHWLTAEEYTDILAISQMTPGPIGINTATYTGYTAIVNEGLPSWLGVAGSLVASFAVVLLPVIAMLLVLYFLASRRKTPAFDTMFRILRLTVVGLIAAAALSLVGVENFGHLGFNRQFVTSVIIFCAVFALSHFRKTNPILLILASGAAGLVVYSI